MVCFSVMGCLVEILDRLLREGWMWNSWPSHSHTSWESSCSYPCLFLSWTLRDMCCARCIIGVLEFLYRVKECRVLFSVEFRGQYFLLVDALF